MLVDFNNFNEDIYGETFYLKGTNHVFRTILVCGEIMLLDCDTGIAYSIECVANKYYKFGFYRIEDIPEMAELLGEGCENFLGVYMVAK